MNEFALFGLFGCFVEGANAHKDILKAITKKDKIRF